MVELPAVRMVTVFPEMVATLALELVYVMVNPEVVVALKLKGESPAVFEMRALKVIV